MSLGRILAFIALLLGCAAPLTGQQTATIRGVVIDSVAGVPLSGATVQLVASARSTVARTEVTDSLGHFAFADVADGEYRIGFMHPALDSLGLEPTVRAVTVAGQRDVAADLAIPSPARLRAAFCGANTGGVIIGFVRAAEGGAPVPGASVAGEWLEYAIGGGRVGQRAARRVATTGENGGFLLCDVPSPGNVRLLAGAGADSTDRVEVDVPTAGILRRDLYVGVARVAARPDTVPADSMRIATRTGPGRLSGTVTASDGGRPLAGVRVGVVDGATTRTDARGEWTLTAAPSGTRMLEVRATGYHTVRRAVDIAPGAPPVNVKLSGLAAMLDTIRAIGRSQSRQALGGFQERRRTLGTGRFLSADNIERRNLLATSDIFDAIPGMSRVRNDEGEGFYMRSAFGEPCVPTVFMNGMRMANISATDIDLLIHPREIAALEVYSESQAPPQFQDAMSGCGSIVVWTK